MERTRKPLRHWRQISRTSDGGGRFNLQTTGSADDIDLESQSPNSDSTGKYAPSGNTTMRPDPSQSSGTTEPVAMIVASPTSDSRQGQCADEKVTSALGFSAIPSAI
jgi:hypothetical protein